MFAECMTTELMFTFHPKQVSFCHLASTRIKERLLKENGILPHTETKELAYPFIFN